MLLFYFYQNKFKVKIPIDKKYKDIMKMPTKSPLDFFITPYTFNMYREIFSHVAAINR